MDTIRYSMGKYKRAFPVATYPFKGETTGSNADSKLGKGYWPAGDRPSLAAANPLPVPSFFI